MLRLPKVLAAFAAVTLLSTIPADALKRSATRQCKTVETPSTGCKTELCTTSICEAPPNKGCRVSKTARTWCRGQKDAHGVTAGGRLEPHLPNPSCSDSKVNNGLRFKGQQTDTCLSQCRRLRRLHRAQLRCTCGFKAHDFSALMID